MRAGNDERLADLQFPVVFDVVEFLQLVDADFVHFRDRSERLAPGDDMGGSARDRCRVKRFPLRPATGCRERFPWDVGSPAANAEFVAKARRF